MNEGSTPVDANGKPAALRLPITKLWFGYKTEPFVGSSDQQKATAESFEGKGHSLRK